MHKRVSIGCVLINNGGRFLLGFCNLSAIIAREFRSFASCYYAAEESWPAVKFLTETWTKREGSSGYPVWLLANPNRSMQSFCYYSVDKYSLTGDSSSSPDLTTDNSVRSAILGLTSNVSAIFGLADDRGSAIAGTVWSTSSTIFGMTSNISIIFGLISDISVIVSGQLTVRPVRLSSVWQATLRFSCILVLTEQNSLRGAFEKCTPPPSKARLARLCTV